jgi:hypothetical protein
MGGEAVSKFTPTMLLRFVRRKVYPCGDNPEVKYVLQQYWNPREMPHIIDGVELGEWRDIPCVDEASANQGAKP